MANSMHPYDLHYNLQYKIIKNRVFSFTERNEDVFKRCTSLMYIIYTFLFVFFLTLSQRYEGKIGQFTKSLNRKSHDLSFNLLEV